MIKSVNRIVNKLNDTSVCVHTHTHTCQTVTFVNWLGKLGKLVTFYLSQASVAVKRHHSQTNSHFFF